MLLLFWQDLLLHLLLFLLIRVLCILISSPHAAGTTVCNLSADSIQIGEDSVLSPGAHPTAVCLASHRAKEFT